MEEWQRKYIIENLDKLLETIYCNTLLLAKLQSSKVLGFADIDTLSLEPEAFTKSRRVLEILITRINAYDILTKALMECRQTGAAKILLSGYWDRGESNILAKLNLNTDFESFLSSPVYFLNKQQKLRDILNGFDDQDLQTVLEESACEQEFFDILITGRKLTLLIDTIPVIPKYYIPRLISNRVTVDADIFKEECADIFVFRNIDRLKLTELARPFNTSTSGKQVENLNSRFILLEDEIDLEEIEKLATEPLHVFKYDNDSNRFTLETTTGNSSVLEKYRMDQFRQKEVYISEESLIDSFQKNENVSGLCLCDTPGIGKSQLLASIAKKTKERYFERIVAYIPFAHLIKSSEVTSATLDPPSVEVAMLLILKHITPSPLAKNLLLQAILKKQVKLELFFDGFDEISLLNIQWAKYFLKIVSENCMGKIYVASRPHHKRDLETTLGVIAYDILPFNSSNQLEFLFSFWKESIPIHDEVKLKEFAFLSVQQLKQVVNSEERDILGIPLVCFLFAETNIVKARIFSDPRRKFPMDASIDTTTTLFTMFKNFIDKRFESQATKTGNDSIDSEEVKRFHVLKALETVLPEIATVYQLNEDLSLQFTDSMQHFQNGLLELKSEYNYSTTAFIHRTFAEYLVAEYLVDILIGHKYADKNKNKLCETSVQYLFAFVLAGKYSGECNFGLNWFYTSDMYPERKRKFVSLHLFDNFMITYFLNAHLEVQYVARGAEMSLAASSISSRVDIRMLPDQLIEILQCCLSHNYIYLFRFLKHFLSGMKPELLEEYMSYSQQNSIRMNLSMSVDFVNRVNVMLYVAAANSNLDMIDEFFQLVNECFQCDVKSVCENIPVKLHTPIHSGIAMVNYDLVEYFIDKVPLKNRWFLYYCVQNTYWESQRTVQKRIDICKLLLSTDGSILNEEAYDPVWQTYTSPLVANGIHLNLIKYLVAEGCNVYATRDDNDTIVTTAAMYFSNTDYHQLVCFLISDCNAEKLFYCKEELSYYPVHCILRNVKGLEIETLQIILNISKVHVNEKDPYGYNLLLSAVAGEQSLSVIQKLLKCGADFNCQNIMGNNSLCLANKKSYIEITELFESLGLNMKSTDITKCAKLQLLVCEFYENKDIYATNKHGETMAHRASKLKSENEFHFMTRFLLKLCSTGDILTIKNKNGQTPLQQRFQLGYITGFKTMKLHLSVPQIRKQSVDECGNNLFLSAVRGNQSIDVLEILVKEKVDFLSCNNDGESALHLAVHNDNLHQVQYCLSIGVDHNIRDSKGATPLERALEYGQRKCGAGIISILQTKKHDILNKCQK